MTRPRIAMRLLLAFVVGVGVSAAAFHIHDGPAAGHCRLCQEVRAPELSGGQAQVRVPPAPVPPRALHTPRTAELPIAATPVGRRAPPEGGS